MGTVLVILGVLVYLVAIGCSIIVLIDAFKDEIWKGIVCLICGLYWLYYAIFEFDHEKKWPIVLTAIFGGAIGSVLVILGQR